MPIPKLLVVEDNKDDLEELMRVLGRERFDVNIALSGEDGQRMLRESRYDSMLLNLKLPGVSGLELLRWAQERWPGMPVHIITGHDAPETRMDVFKAGAVCLWRKPYESAANLAVMNLLRMKENAFEEGRASAHASPKTTRAGLMTAAGILSIAGAYWVGDLNSIVSSDVSLTVKGIGVVLAAVGSALQGIHATDKTSRK